MSNTLKKYIKYKTKYFKLKKINGGSLNENIQKMIENEPRIINLFAESTLSLPEWFNSIKVKKIMLAAGDGYYQNGENGMNSEENETIIKRPQNMPTDIQFMSDENYGSYNIFCCDQV